MAARLACQRARVVALMPNMQAAVRHFRAFSHEKQQTVQEVLENALSNNQRSDWPDAHLGPLGPQDARFPLPGIMGPLPNPTPPPTQSDPSSDLLDEPLPHQRQMAALRQFNHVAKEEESVMGDVLGGGSRVTDTLECVAMECPDLVKRDLQDLFPEHNLAGRPLTVMTLSQRTINDMTMWNTAVDEEREQLLENFITSASEICAAIHDAGYWADFIDPSSGRPYLGAYTNNTLFETDERYRNFGFEINDLGCCKVISHHLWGSHAFVGSIFTSAPVSHPVIKQLSDTTDE